MGSENSKRSDMDDFEVPIFKHGKNISVLNYLSRGGEGTVYTAQTRDKRGKHPNILEIFGTYEGFNPDTQNVYRGYVMEFMAGRSLNEAIYSDKPYEPEQAYHWMRQISHAVVYMHLKKIAHLDLKPLNMLLDATGTRVKIGDFGLSKNLMFSKLTARRATYAYMAPELFDEEIDLHEQSLYKADVYSLGVTFWEILYRKPPFNGLSLVQICEKVKAGERPSMEKFIWEEEIRELIEKSWIGIPYERCSLPDYIYTLNTVLQEPTDFRDFLPVSLQAVAANYRATPMHIAAQQGDNVIVEMLIITGASVSSKDKDGWTPLHYAVWNNYIEIARTLLKHRAPIDAVNVFGRTLLHLASEKGNVDMVNLLLQHEAIVDREDNNHDGPLHMAVCHGHHLVVEMLIKAGASVTSKTINGSTPLHYAVWNNYIEIVRTLLKHRAPIDAVDVFGRTLLHLASEKGNVDMVNLLLQHEAIVDSEDNNYDTPFHAAAHGEQVVNVLLGAGALVSSKDEDGWTPLHFAAGHNDVECARTLLKHRVPIDAAAYIGTPLHIAAQKGHVDMVKFLLKHGAIIDSEDDDHHTPLHVAAFYGHHLVVEMLITAGASVSSKNEDGVTPLHCAAIRNHIESAAILLKHYAPIDAATVFGEDSLHFAAQKGHVDMVKFLLKHGAIIDSEDNDHHTPLHVAAFYGHHLVVEMLITAGASVSSKNEDGETLLHCAAIRNHIESAGILLTAQEGHDQVMNVLLGTGASIYLEPNNGRSFQSACFKGAINYVTYLLKHGANPNTANGGQTALCNAAYSNHVDVVNILILYGANVDARNNDGRSALHIASCKGNVDIVNLLLQAGANPNSVDKNNTTPLVYAREEGHNEVAAILVKYGARFVLHLRSSEGED